MNGMDSIMQCFSKFMVLVMSVFTLFACSQHESSGEITVLRLGHTLDTQHSVHKAMEFLGERLEYYSDGKMTVIIYPGSQLGTEREMIELLQIGSLAMTKVSASPLEGFSPDMKIFRAYWKLSKTLDYQRLYKGPNHLLLRFHQIPH